MGTNYYWIESTADSENSIQKHIGKHSSAGWYCYDCGTTLCKQGTIGLQQKSEWFDKCPSCGKNVTTRIMRFTWTLMKHLKEIQDLAKKVLYTKLSKMSTTPPTMQKNF